ncbi:MAG: TfuA-like protein [Solirubrobacteraceae bacterium]
MYDGTIVIIDGEFQQSLSVSPKEILQLLDTGTRVIGAASMGALRAVELERYGMEGFGWVFAAYRSGRLDADDEVAVSYLSEDMTCLTVPLVSVRRWLDELTAGGDVDEWTAGWLLERARQLFYADRTPEKLWSVWSHVIATSELERLLAVTGGHVFDVKAADVLIALNALAVSRYKPTQQEGDYAGRSTTE